MYRSFLVALWCVLTVSVALAQDKPEPEQLAKIGPTVHAPVPTQQPEAEMPDEARKARINGICLVSLIVDLEGEPTNVRIIRCTDPIFAKNSMEAVAKYRFKPAVRITDGNPVPVKLIIEVNFTIYRSRI